MKRIVILLLGASLGLAGWWLWENPAQLHDIVGEYIDSSQILTLEIKHPPERVMEQRRKELLPDTRYTFQEPVIKYYPYLLIEAKYAQEDHKTREGALLWSLIDGELVLDTLTWEKTEGFADAIRAGANRADFRVMYAVEKRGGSATREELQKELRVETDTLVPWIQSALDKQLLVQSGNSYRLHLQNPKILVAPESHIRQEFVSKPLDRLDKVGRRYTRSQVEKVTYAAFGSSFAIRDVREIFLPVVLISVQNPDGTLHQTHWNALNGQKVAVLP